MKETAVYILDLSHWPLGGHNKNYAIYELISSAVLFKSTQWTGLTDENVASSRLNLLCQC